MSCGSDNAPCTKRQALTARNIESRSAARGFRDDAMEPAYNLILLRFALLRVIGGPLEPREEAPLLRAFGL